MISVTTQTFFLFFSIPRKNNPQIHKIYINHGNHNFELHSTENEENSSNIYVLTAGGVRTQSFSSCFWEEAEKPRKPLKEEEASLGS